MDTPELYYYRARYYDPTIQRFLSFDPIRLQSGDFNFYRYAGNDPVNYVDPWGLESNATDEATPKDIIISVATSLGIKDIPLVSSAAPLICDNADGVVQGMRALWQISDGIDPQSKYLDKIKSKEKAEREKCKAQKKKKDDEEKMENLCNKPKVDKYGFEKWRSPYSEPCKSYFKTHAKKC